METSASLCSSAPSLLHKRNSSSLARKIALAHPELNLEILLGQGSGPKGKLMSADILLALKPASPSASDCLPTTACPEKTAEKAPETTQTAVPASEEDDKSPKEKTFELTLPLLSFLLVQINKQTENTQNTLFTLEDFLLKTLIKASRLCPSLKSEANNATLTLWDIFCADCADSPNSPSSPKPYRSCSFIEAEKNSLLSLAQRRAIFADVTKEGQKVAPSSYSLSPLAYCPLSLGQEEKPSTLISLLPQEAPQIRLLVTSSSPAENPSNNKLTLGIFSPAGALPSGEFEAFCQELVTFLENPTLVLL